MIPLILASSSERRIFLLKKSGINFIAVNHKLESEPLFEDSKGNTPASIGDFVQNLALMKAKSLQDDYAENWIIGADTLIYINGTVYGKPKNSKDAFNMIKELSGKIHIVYTGIALINKYKNIYVTDYDKTAVKIKMLSDKEITSYLSEYPPAGKAGSYGIQDEHGIVESYEGSFENVLGLPVQKLKLILLPLNMRH
ncbi:MAG: Maf family protein [Deltaproteobacteria bacterium]|jgi:septum formation protein|nr:Maf family protein [Deltaproteobacteria bacterium]